MCRTFALATSRASGVRPRCRPLIPNRPIPSETALVQEFGIARGTARHAVELLRERGLVATIPGRGTFVLPRRRRLGSRQALFRGRSTVPASPRPCCSG
ncbi:GntR family transcriptional regulator [Actinoplanes sp. NPDC000266]